jgi:hypothetical protein
MEISNDTLITKSILIEYFEYAGYVKDDFYKPEEVDWDYSRYVNKKADPEIIYLNDYRVRYNTENGLVRCIYSNLTLWRVGILDLLRISFK